ncbi:hypothetical protein GCM10027162_23840 [Streptomyces incanus]
MPGPGIKEPGDAIVRGGAVSVCGTDLHLRKGDIPAVPPGTVLGHEAVGEIVETGGDVRTVHPGDRALVSCVTTCGRCRYCRAGRYGRCRGAGGRILGHLIDGTQAEYVRVPYADLSVYPLPGTITGEDAVLPASLFPAAYEGGVQLGSVWPERVVAVHVAAARLESARALGADAAAEDGEDFGRPAADLTAGAGTDVVIEAVGRPETFELCTRGVGSGGHLANVGVHAAPPRRASRTCGARASPSPPGWSTPAPPRPCFGWRRPACRPADNRSPTPSRSTVCRRRTTSSATPPNPERSRSSSAESGVKSSRRTRPDGRRHGAAREPPCSRFVPKSGWDRSARSAHAPGGRVTDPGEVAHKEVTSHGEDAWCAAPQGVAVALAEQPAASSQ